MRVRGTRGVLENMCIKCMCIFSFCQPLFNIFTHYLQSYFVIYTTKVQKKHSKCKKICKKVKYLTKKAYVVLS